jgi:hypothetical protein
VGEGAFESELERRREAVRLVCEEGLSKAEGASPAVGNQPPSPPAAVPLVAALPPSDKLALSSLARLGGRHPEPDT